MCIRDRTDPISIPHQFSKKEDIEIAGFLSATIAWGQRTTILKNANEIVQKMDFAPVSYTHLRAHETVLDLVCRLLLEKKNNKQTISRFFDRTQLI